MSKQVTINEKSYNVYADLDDAENYFNAKFGSQWATLEDIVKNQLLVSATRYIDSKDYIGDKVDKEQLLKFPRIYNNEQSDENMVMICCLELAESIYSNGSTGGNNTDITNIKTVKLGDSSITYKDDVTVSSDNDNVLEDYLAQWLMTGGFEIIL